MKKLHNSALSGEIAKAVGVPERLVSMVLIELNKRMMYYLKQGHRITVPGGQVQIETKKPRLMYIPATGKHEYTPEGMKRIKFHKSRALQRELQKEIKK